MGRLVVVLLVAATLVGLVVWYLPLIRAHKSLQSQLYETRQAIQHERQVANRIQADISAFDRPETIEWLARTLADHARTNEIVFRFADE